MFFISCIVVFVLANTVQGQNATCTRVGVQCSSDCNSVWFCSAVGAAPIVTDNCQSRNLSCTQVNTTTAACVAPANSNCASTGPGGQLPIECMGGGLVPDPYNCLRGYVCSVQSPTPVDQCDCAAGTYWNVDNQCGTVAGEIEGCCTGRGASVCADGAIDGDFGTDCYPQYYYVCAINSAGERVIHVLQCDAGQVYDTTSHTCVIITTTTETTTTPTETTLPTEANTGPIFSFNPYWVNRNSLFGISNKAAATCVPYVPPTDVPPTTPPFSPTCSRPGEIIPDPNDTRCRTYAVCDDNLQPIISECIEGTHLDCTNGCNCVFGGGCPPGQNSTQQYIY